MGYQRAFGFLGVVIGCLVVGSVHAQPPVNTNDLEAFVDGAVAVAMDRNHVAGAVVAVILDGDPLLLKGYGFADVLHEKPVDADTTLFRIASITKTFTWLSVMQQIERGALDLDRDINEYLKEVQVPQTYSEPITMRHLMTHTAGFEDKIVGVFSRTPDAVRPLAEMLQQELPQRVRRPGVLVAYSNHGASLAGLVLADAVGTSWEDYIENEILNPLGMRHTTPRQPVPTELEPHLSKGYIFEGGQFVEQPFQFVTTPPAGSMSSTAGDMVKYMTMLLNFGAHPGGTLVSNATGEEMTRTLFTPHPQVSGLAYGFAEHQFNGLRFVGHGGSTEVFQSYLLLNHEHGFGIFVANNSSAGAFDLAIIRVVLDRLFPPPAWPQLGRVEETTGTSEMVSGTYIPLRREYTGPAKIGAILPGSAIHVTAEPDGAIRATVPDSSSAVRFVEVERWVYRTEDRSEAIAFGPDPEGRIRYLYLDTNPYQSYERASVFQGIGFNAIFIGIVLLVLIGAVVGWPIRAIATARKRSSHAPASGLATAITVFAWCVAVLQLTFVVRLAGALSNPDEIVFGMSDAGRAALSMTVPLAVASAVLVVVAGFALKQRYWSLPRRLQFSTVALASLALAAWEHYWNLLGHRY